MGNQDVRLNIFVGLLRGKGKIHLDFWVAFALLTNYDAIFHLGTKPRPKSFNILQSSFRLTGSVPDSCLCWDALQSAQAKRGLHEYNHEAPKSKLLYSRQGLSPPAV